MRKNSRPVFVMLNTENVVINISHRRPEFSDLDLVTAKWTGKGKPLKIGDKVSNWDGFGATFSKDAFEEICKSLEDDFARGLHPDAEPIFSRRKESIGLQEPEGFFTASDRSEAKMLVLASCMTIDDLVYSVV